MNSKKATKVTGCLPVASAPADRRRCAEVLRGWAACLEMEAAEIVRTKPWRSAAAAATKLYARAARLRGEAAEVADVVQQQRRAAADVLAQLAQAGLAASQASGGTHAEGRCIDAPTGPRGAA